MKKIKTVGIFKADVDYVVYLDLFFLCLVIYMYNDTFIYTVKPV